MVAGVPIALFERRPEQEGVRQVGAGIHRVDQHGLGVHHADAGRGEGQGLGRGTRFGEVLLDLPGVGVGRAVEQVVPHVHDRDDEVDEGVAGTGNQHLHRSAALRGGDHRPFGPGERGRIVGGRRRRGAVKAVREVEHDFGALVRGVSLIAAGHVQCQLHHRDRVRCILHSGVHRAPGGFVVDERLHRGAFPHRECVGGAGQRHRPAGDVGLLERDSVDGGRVDVAVRVGLQVEQPAHHGGADRHLQLPWAEFGAAEGVGSDRDGEAAVRSRGRCAKLARDDRRRVADDNPQPGQSVARVVSVDDLPGHGHAHGPLPYGPWAPGRCTGLATSIAVLRSVNRGHFS